MRDTKHTLRRILPDNRRVFLGAVLLVLTTGCGLNASLDGYDFAPSEYVIARGYPDLMPISAFRIADYAVPDPSNLAVRFAMLKRKIVALRGPVISSSDRARLNAALKRTASTQG